MSDKIYIDKEVLKECLAKAFDEGWTGYKDLKEDVVDRLLKVLSEKVEKEKPDPMSNGNWVTWNVGTASGVPPVTEYISTASTITLSDLGIRGNGSDGGFISYST